MFLYHCRTGDSAPDFAYGDLLVEDARYMFTLPLPLVPCQQLR